MKKILFILAVLMLAAPAWADVDITCAQVEDTNEVIVSFDATGEDPNFVRAIALDIELSDGNVVEVNCTNADYDIYPGSIVIEGGVVTDEGSCECDDSYAGTLGGVGTPGVTSEQASLYEKGVDDDPVQSGPLLSFFVKGGVDCTVTITVNEIRGGVVMEDGTSPTVNAPGCDVVFPEPGCSTCKGDVDENDWVMTDDLIDLLNALAATAPNWYFECDGSSTQDCMDWDDNGWVMTDDLVDLLNALAATAPDWYYQCPPE